ncbi:MAG: hypothetical protein D6732_02285 [Methanobacteriota archaeon]|nr:MAG: hypothetical protein D6732_02285 [Euryarchaeota archaeon]
MKFMKLVTSTVGVMIFLGMMLAAPSNIKAEKVVMETPPENPNFPGNVSVPVNVTYGTPVSVAGNESVELVTPTGISVSLIPGDNLEITMEEFDVNPAGPIQEGLVSFDFFLSIEPNDTNVEVEATIAVPYNGTNLGEANEEDLEMRYYNESTGLWDAVPSWVDLENKVVYGNTTHFSIWTFTANGTQPPEPPTEPPVNDTRIPINVTLGNPVSIQPGQEVELITPSGISVSLTPAEGLEITIDQFTSNPAGELQQGIVSLGIYLSIEPNDTSVELNATIAVPYNETMLNGTNPETLEMRYYNESTGLWEAVPSWVDLENKMVYGNTTHFSVWTATGEEEIQQIPTNPATPIAQPGAPFEIQPGKPVAVRPGERVELVTPSGIMVAVIPGEGVEITIEEFTSNPAGELPQGLQSAGIFIDITVNDSSTSIDATLTLPLENLDLKGINLNTLEFRYFDESAKEWRGVPSWVENNAVYANTTHFSLWTVVGQTDGESSANSEVSVLFLFGAIGIMVATLFRKRKN